MKQKQSGSVHLIITIILVLALLGALGFIFWQNFINKKDSTSTTATASSQAATNTAPASAATPTNDNLVVSQWGVTVPVKDFVLLSSSDENHIYVTTQAIIDEAKRISCTDTSIGNLYRVTTTADQPSYAALSSKIGTYYYGFWTGSQAACTDSQGNAPVTINSLMMDAEKAMNAAIVNTKAS